MHTTNCARSITSSDALLTGSGETGSEMMWPVSPCWDNFQGGLFFSVLYSGKFGGVIILQFGDLNQNWQMADNAISPI